MITLWQEAISPGRTYQYYHGIGAWAPPILLQPKRLIVMPLIKIPDIIFVSKIVINNVVVFGGNLHRVNLKFINGGCMPFRSRHREVTLAPRQSRKQQE
jgi:hypothetical protein